MRCIRRPLVIASLSLGTIFAGKAQNPPRSSSVQPYQISFQREEAIPGIVASHAIATPLQCTTDGTVFVNMVLQPSIFTPPTDLLVAVSRAREPHEFRLDRVTDLYDLDQKTYYASEAGVAFLVIAAPEDKQGKEAFVDSEGTKHEVVRNLADRHDYLVMFDRTGNYQRKVQIEAALAIQRVGVFRSGAILAFGFDPQDHSPELGLFDDRGNFSRFFEIPKGSAPKSMLQSRDDSGNGLPIYVPSQMVPRGESIIVVQNSTDFPLLEVSEAGAIRRIKPQLPKNVRLETLVPSDDVLYARVSDPRYPIYELDPRDGTVLRRFRVGAQSSADEIACVHDGKFLSFEHTVGKLIPLVGTAEPTADIVVSDQKK